MTNEPLHGKATDAEYLLDLAKRMRNVPVMYGVNGFDIDCVADLSTRLRKAVTPPPVSPALVQCEMEDGTIENLAGCFDGAEEINGVRVLKKTPLHLHPETPSPVSHVVGIEAFDRAYPELFYKIGKGRLSPKEPMYGAVIEMANGEPIGEGESNVSLAAAFEAALADSVLPVPDDYPTVCKEDVLRALHILMQANGHDLDVWTGGILPSDEITEAYRAAIAAAEGPKE